MIVLRGNKKDGIVYLNDKLLDYSKINHNLLDHTKDVSVATHEINKSFTWGYPGEGPKYLAMAILFELTDVETAIKNCIKFRNEVIANIKDGDFYLLIDENEYSETISTQDPFLGIITDRDVYVYREIYYEIFKRARLIPGITPGMMDAKISEACEKFGWTLKKYLMFRSIDGVQRFVKNDSKQEKVLIKNIDGDEKEAPIYNVMDFPQLQCPIRTENATTLWKDCDGNIIVKSLK